MFWGYDASLHLVGREHLANIEHMRVAISQCLIASVILRAKIGIERIEVE